MEKDLDTNQGESYPEFNNQVRSIILYNLDQGLKNLAKISDIIIEKAKKKY